MIEKVMKSLGGKIELELLPNELCKATLVGGSRQASGHGTSFAGAMLDMVNAVNTSAPPDAFRSIAVVRNKQHYPAAIIVYSNKEETLSFYSADEDGNALDQMTQDDADAALEFIAECIQNGEKIVTWGGLRFDFRTIAMVSDIPLASKIALDHYDMGYQMLSIKGFSVHPFTAYEGMKIPFTKQDDMISVMWEMNPDAAIQEATRQAETVAMLWAAIDFNGRTLDWVSKSGKPASCQFGRMMTVAECNEMPEPDLSWMDKPVDRSEQLRWMRVE